MVVRSLHEEGEQRAQPTSVLWGLTCPCLACPCWTPDSPSRSPSKVEVTEKVTTMLPENSCPSSTSPSSSRKSLGRKCALPGPLHGLRCLVCRRSRWVLG